MTGVRRRLIGLGLPPLVFSLLDCAVTLAGQSDAYWGGNYAAVNEMSPTFHHLLAAHPLAFLGGTVGWIAVFVAIILLLPDTLALIVSIGVTFGHAVGVSTWVVWRYEYGYQAANGLFLLAAVALGLGIRYGWRAGPPEPYRLPPALARWRWPLSAALFAAGVYLFLWPRDV